MPPESDHRVGSTARREEARRSITRTTITPAPGVTPEPTDDEPARSPGERFGGRRHGRLTAAQPPYEGASVLRLVVAVLLSALCLLTVGGAILVLLLWQQDRASGVLTSQLERTWDLFDALRVIERWVAFATVPIAMAWSVFAALNVRRATGVRRNPVVAALSVPVAALGVWVIGDRIVAEADDWIGQVAGFVLQCVFLAVPLLVMLRLAQAAESRNRPLRAAFVVAAAYVAHVQFLAGLSTADQQSPPDEWGRLGAYLIIGALIQLLGALSVNEAARAVEEGTQHRFELRNRFGESLLEQAARGSG